MEFVSVCSDCICNKCLNNVNSTLPNAAKHQCFPCFNCDDCYRYDNQRYKAARDTGLSYGEYVRRFDAK